jgi:hypothetical protein
MGLKILLTLFVALVGVYLYVNFVSSPASPNPVIFMNCTQAVCEDVDGVRVCTCGQVNSSDDVYGNGSLTSGVGFPANLTVWLNYTDIPEGSRILNVDLIVEWKLSASTGNVCAVDVYNGSWVNVTTTCPGTADTTNTLNISDIITTETLAENISVRINLTRVATNGLLYVDLVTVNITYLPPHPFLSWGLVNASDGAAVSDGDNFTRSDSINASAQWANVISSALVEHNGTGSLVNYSIPSPFGGNWTNYTLNFSNYTQFPLAGNITVNAIYATDEFGQENLTSPPHFFYLWGHAGVEGIYFEPVLLNGSSAALYCNVTDSNSSAVVPNYNVSFWKNDSFLGSNVTNSSGLASFSYLDSTTIVNSTSQSFEFKCNITDQASVYYNASALNGASSNLSIVDVMEINLTMNETVYNRGENLTVRLLDTSNNSLQSVTWAINLTKFNQSSALVFSGTADNYTFAINSSDPAGNWTLRVNATRSGRELVRTFYFNVSSSLRLKFLVPAAGTQYSANAIIEDPEVLVRNQRNENLSYAVNATLVCPNGQYPVSASGGIYKNASQTCRASASSGVSFVLAANATDSFNNSGEAELSLSTSSPPGSTSGSPGGGGGGGSIAPACECGNWTSNNICGYGICPEDFILETRTCSPAGCSNESRCVYNPACSGEADFNFTSGTEQIEIEQGGEGTFIVTVTNTGDLPLNLTITVWKECCNISFPADLELLPRESGDVPVSVHASLSQEPGEYLLTLNMSAGPVLKKSKTLRFLVLENPLLGEIGSLQERLGELEGRIEEYRKAGVDTTELEKKRDEVRSLIAGAFASISRDSSSELRANIESARQAVGEAFRTLAGMGLMKLLAENRWYIVSGVMLIIIASYLVTEVLVPFYRLGKNIMRLEKEEKALVKTRIETEKQYFRRIIDEKTFRAILVEGQGKILRVRGALKTQREARSSILRTRLSPVYFLRWVSGWITRKKLRALGRRLAKRKETPQEAGAKGLLRNVLSGLGLDVSGRGRKRQKN